MQFETRSAYGPKPHADLYSKLMKRNLGGLDKVVRFLLGIAGGLLVYYELVTGPLAFITLVIVAVLLLTSLIGFCPLYGILGINSCRPHH